MIKHLAIVLTFSTPIWTGYLALRDFPCFYLFDMVSFAFMSGVAFTYALVLIDRVVEGAKK